MDTIFNATPITPRSSASVRSVPQPLVSIFPEPIPRPVNRVTRQNGPAIATRRYGRWITAAVVVGVLGFSTVWVAGNAFRRNWLLGTVGSARAQYITAACYKAGDRVKQDVAKAAAWYARAAANGFPQAQYELGLMQYFGTGVKEDRSAALASFRAGARSGLVEAQRVAAALLLEGSDPGQFREAEKWLLAASEAGDEAAKCLLMCEYGSGAHLPQDLERSDQMLNELAGSKLDAVKEQLEIRSRIRAR